MGKFLASAIAIFVGISASAQMEAGAVRTVPYVDLARFSGTWYEIASFPSIFQQDCVATSATYTPLPDGRFDVFNQCRNKNFQGRERSIHGTATVTDRASNAKLDVQFYKPLSAAYWIIGLGPNYEYATTASPDRRYLWVLSRTRQMEERVYAEIIGQASDQGFDISKLRRTQQPAD